VIAERARAVRETLGGRSGLRPILAIMVRASAVRLLVACLVAAALAGCGAVPSGRRASLAASSAVAAGPRVVSGAQLSRELSAAAVESGTAHVTIRRAAAWREFGQQTVTGVVRFADPAAGAYDVADDANEFRVVVVAGSAYVRGLPTRVRGKPWLQFDAGDLSGSLLTQILDDPAAITQFGLGLSFTDSGSTTVPGARQYSAHLTTEQLLASVGEPGRDEARAWAKRKSVAGATILVFVDGNGLPVKQIFTVVPNSVEVTFQTEYSRWGEPVSITAPPQRKVARCAKARLCPKPLVA